MPYHRITIERDKLYEQVWTEPIHKLCKQYFLSDRGLGKLCERHNIPVPPRGYWARVAHGQKPKRPPLPPLKEGQRATIYIERYLKYAPGEEPPSHPIPPEVLYERVPEHRVTVPEDLRVNHPLIRGARRLLRGVKPDDRGMLQPPSGCLHIRVSRTAQTRAVRIVQALFDAMAARGWTVRVATETDYNRRPVTRTLVKVLGEEIALGLEERAKQVPHVLTVYQKDSIKRGYEPYLPPWDLAPSGVLVLQVLTGWPQREFKDSAKQPLEHRLNDFLVALVEKALQEKKDRERRAIEEQRRQEAEQRQREEEARQREEDEKIEQWDTWMNAWKRAQDVRAFAAAIREALAPIEPGSKIERRLSWAADYADRIDPLSQKA